MHIEFLTHWERNIPLPWLLRILTYKRILRYELSCPHYVSGITNRRRHVTLKSDLQGLSFEVVEDLRILEVKFSDSH